MNKNVYWQKFYKNKTFNKKVDFPSQFSIFTLSQKQENDILLEFGCGNGRDASYMSKYYKKIYAFDISESAIYHNKMKFKKIKNLNFKISDVTKIFNTKDYKKLRKTIYTRFFIHTLTDNEIKIFIKLLSNLLNKDEKIFLEYRTHLDKNNIKVFKNHYRNYLNPQKIINFFHREKFKNIYSVYGNGLAIFGKEDPHVARQIFQKK